MDVLEDLKKSLLNITLVMTYMIYKILVMLKITQITLKIVSLNALLRSAIDFYFFLKK